MLLKYTVIFLVIVVAVKSATIQERNIPVEIRYERNEHDITGNLREKVQLSEEQLKENQLRLQKFQEEENVVAEAEEAKDHSFLTKNLNEKVQLSPEELLQSSKHIPIQQTLETETNLEKLEENLSTKASLIDKAQDLIENGLKALKANFIPTENQLAPPKELWEKLENDVKDFFAEEKNKLGSRQDQGANQQNIFQNFANGFQQMTNNFIQQFQGLNQNGQNGTSGDEGTQQQGPIQGFIGYFTGGVQNIVSNIQNLGQNGQQTSGNSTVLGDSGTNNQGQPGNIIGNIVNGVQQFFQGPQQGINQILSSNNTQGDTGTGQPGSTQQQGFFAGAINQFNSVVSNIIPTTAKPATQGDEGSASTGGGTQSGPIQQVIQSFGNIGNAFNQFIQGGQQNKPSGSEDENASQAPPQNQNFIQSIGQNIGNAFQTIQNQFRPPTPSNFSGIAGSSDGANAIVGQAVNAGTQIQQVAGQVAGNNPIQNLIPGSSGSSSSESPAKASAVETETPEPVVTLEADADKKEVMTATE